MHVNETQGLKSRIFPFTEKADHLPQEKKAQLFTARFAYFLGTKGLPFDRIVDMWFCWGKKIYKKRVKKLRFLEIFSNKRIIIFASRRIHLLQSNVSSCRKTAILLLQWINKYGVIFLWIQRCRFCSLMLNSKKPFNPCYYIYVHQ